MKRSAGPNNTPRALCRCALASSMLLALPVSFAQNNPVQNTRNEAASKSILERGKNNGKNASMGVFIPNLPLSGFLASYNSKDSEERIAAHTFLLGVSDATEGKVWCSYYKFKSITVLESVYSGLQELDPSRYDERAAYVISEILEKNHPCKNGR